MNSTSADPAPLPPHRSAARRPKATTSEPKSQARKTSAPRHAPAARRAPSFSPLDLEALEDLQAAATRKVRALMRDEPMMLLGGAFASGYVLGGGWRTRIGRMMLIAAGRYVALEAAKHYFQT